MPYKETNVEQNNDSVSALVREAETDYISTTTTISKYVQFSLKDTVDTIDAYLNSQFTSGQVDSLGRPKPFFNIVTAAANIWFRATDIDRKDIKVRATKSADVTAAFLATVHLQYWMKKINFGSFLNDWGRTLSRYGSAVSKFIEKNGELYATVVPWNRLIVDSINFENNIKIEVLEFTEAELYKQKGYDQDMVKQLCNALQARRTIEGQTKDNKSDYVRVYEVHGELPLSYITEKDSDADEYVQQMHVVSYVASSNKKGDYDDFTLVKGREARDPYMITHLIKEDGRSLSIGAVEHLFMAQWMVNHTAKAIKDQLDLASKLIFQTADDNFVGQNALTSIETGQILKHAMGMPLTQLANNSHDTQALSNYQQMWKSVGNEIVGISESMLGQAAPSGTAWRQVETLLQQNQSLFELMTENKGLALEDMIRAYVIPYVKKQLKNNKEIAATLDHYDIQKIDAKFVKRESIKKTNKEVFNKVLNGEKPTPEDQQQMLQKNATNLQNNLSELGNTRFFAPDEIDWKTELDDMEWDLDIDITGESFDKEALTTLNTLLTFFAKKQGQPLTPEEKLVTNKILMLTDAVSPLEISSIPTPPPTPPPSPIQTPPQTTTVPTQ